MQRLVDIEGSDCPKVDLNYRLIRSLILQKVLEFQLRRLAIDDPNLQVGLIIDELTQFLRRHVGSWDRFDRAIVDAWPLTQKRLPN